MKNIKEIWMKYQMEQALQLIELESPDQNELRIKELEKQMKKGIQSSDLAYEIVVPVNKPEA